MRRPELEYCVRAWALAPFSAIAKLEEVKEMCERQDRIKLVSLGIRWLLFCGCQPQGIIIALQI